MKHMTCPWCKNPTGAIRITLTTKQGREEVCASCGRAEVERRKRAKLNEMIADHVMDVGD